jgi:hypothetical protein
VKRLPDLFLQLLDSGVELVFAAPTDRFPELVRDHARASTVELPLLRQWPDGDGVRLFRALADLVRFLGPAFHDARWPRRRALRRVLQLAGHRQSRAISKQAVDVELPAEVCGRVGGALRALEQQIPPDPELEAAVGALGVDAVLLVSRCVLGGNEPEVLKVARHLGLPSIMLVWSWDNLSSKATLNEHPDHLLVWNELQAREAVEFHGIPQERVRALGAANFDPFFAELREAQAEPAETPLVLYLGSSPKVVPDEPAVFARWLAAVRASSDERLRTARIAVRPHPASRRWDGWTPPAGVELSAPDAKVEAPTLARLLTRADAVVALNTSAELEAAIAGKPVLTFRAGAEARGQEGSLHFHYLLEERGGFVLDAATLEEHVGRLSAVLSGDYDPEQARRFVSTFIRPGGLDRPVAPQIAAAIAEQAAHRRPAPPRPEPIPAPVRGSRPRLLVLSPPLLVASLPDVFAELLDAGVEVLFSGRLADQVRVPDELASHASAEVVPLPLAQHDDEAEELVRALRDGLRFLDESLADAAWARARAHRRLLKLARHPERNVRLSPFEGLRLPHGVSQRLDDALRRAAGLVPPPEPLVRAIAELGADAIVLVTRCTLGGYEGDVIKVARLLGIPSIVIPWSWDNLSSKAVIHEQPSRILVWNDVLASEAVELHGIPRDRVEVVGAPTFDRFFAQVEALEPPPSGDGRKTIVYAGSSSNVAPDEPEVFARWLDAVRGAADPAVREARVRVRPHPGHGPWRTWEPPDDPLVTLEQWPRHDRQRLAPLLASADAVVALNTSAELEAAIVGRPVLTFRAGAGAPGQEGSLHFRYLLAGDGGFVIDTGDLAEHVQALSRVLAGDVDVDRQRAFVERFLRPAGIDRPVSPLVASVILGHVGRPAAVAAEPAAPA